ncbi:hypothetical protein MC7420_1168 [Coleofasciculus chthonoplastes PCC 7420]|uniref:Uncharacterized protein n=1 Tax=Coleofasciculus chthonoplastes PCC 7420 TaxID=118168 RepID=B4VXF8_9CYAN|nr:hypothetical protein MC7420_1168 [Coleofasciculus chthonoplastes PCC 7420]
MVRGGNREQGTGNSFTSLSQANSAYTSFKNARISSLWVSKPCT